jgi:nucleoid-associated protein EbfC
MKGGLADLMKKAQELQSNLQKTQQELEALEVVGESGGGMVKITMNGRHDVRRVNIDTTLLGNDKEMLEDLVAAAINDSIKKVEKLSKEKMSDVAGGLGLPSGFKLPF